MNEEVSVCMMTNQPFCSDEADHWIEKAEGKTCCMGLLLKEINGNPVSSYAFDEKNLSSAWLIRQGLVRKDGLLSREALLHQAFRNYTLDLNFMNFSFQEYIRYYATYMVFRKMNQDQPWACWQESMRDYPLKGMDVRAYQDEILYQVFLQYEMFLAWKDFKSRCMDHEIKLLGVLPLFISRDSADGWSHRELFKDHGYDWDAMRKEDYRWFIDRIAYTERLYDGCILTGIEQCEDLKELSSAMEALQKQDADLKIYVPMTANRQILNFQQRFHLDSVRTAVNTL